MPLLSWHASVVWVCIMFLQLLTELPWFWFRRRGIGDDVPLMLNGRTPRNASVVGIACVFLFICLSAFVLFNSICIWVLVD
ncbi:hypothetical protein BX070DRAFT_92231 [Coemansia spiralis]|nr:hypothetical protein BX070DRAFT_92231 [Coemansia spiralis]